MKSVVALASALFVTLAASDAGAVTKWKYTYVGNVLPVTSIENPTGPPTGDLEAFAGYGFDLVIDERDLPGGTLKNAEFVFRDVPSAPEFPSLPQNEDKGFVSLTNFGEPDFGVEPRFRYATEIILKTGNSREAVDYFLTFADLIGGEPFDFSGFIAPTGDQYSSGFISCTEDCVIRSNTDPGSWTVAPVPVPAALPLALAWIGALGLAGWRHRRKADA